MKNVTYVMSGQTSTVQLSDEDIAILQSVAAKNPAQITITSITELTARQNMIARRATRKATQRGRGPVVLTDAERAELRSRVQVGG